MRDHYLTTAELALTPVFPAKHNWTGWAAPHFRTRLGVSPGRLWMLY